MNDKPDLQKQLDWLRDAEVLPLVLATDTTWGEDFEVHVVLLDPDEAVPNGYGSLHL